MVSRGQGKSIEESDNDAAFQRKFNLVQEIYELLPPYTIFILCCASRWMFQSQTLEVFRFFSCEELEAVYYIRGFWQRLMASHYCPNYFSYVSSGCGSSSGGGGSTTKYIIPRAVWEGCCMCLASFLNIFSLPLKYLPSRGPDRSSRTKNPSSSGETTLRRNFDTSGITKPFRPPSERKECNKMLAGR